MKRILLMIAFLILLAQPVYAMEFQAPEVPQSAKKYIRQENSFGQDLWYVFKTAIGEIQPDISQAAGVCLSLTAVVMLVSVIQSVPGSRSEMTELVGVIGVGVLLLQPTNTLIHIGTQTITEMTDYGELLLPVMTGAMAAQGGTTASAALNLGTTFFSITLTTMISKLLIPLLYIFLCLCIAGSAIKQKPLKDLRDFSKWLITWSLKTVLYIFTGYMGITNVISGSADAAAIKATKLTIASAVPVVGGILSDASETILVSAGVMKSAAGAYGVIAMVALFIGPFLKIGGQYLLLKLTSAVCGIFSTKSAADLIKDFSSAMGLVLAMTGTVCLLQLISTVCFMNGVNG